MLLFHSVLKSWEVPLLIWAYTVCHGTSAPLFRASKGEKWNKLMLLFHSVLKSWEVPLLLPVPPMYVFLKQNLFNPLYTGRLFHCYMLDKSSFKGAPVAQWVKPRPTDLTDRV